MKEMTAKMRKFRSLNILSASRKAQGLAPSFLGGVLGNPNDRKPMSREKTPARMSMSPRMAISSGDLASMRQAARASPAAIQPIVPQTRILPKSFSESRRLMKAMELVRARVGA